MTATYLFVYGTLMRNIDSQIARFLGINSQFIAEGKMRGYLYDVGFYPAALHLSDAEATVVGHIFELRNVETTLATLDEYEGAAYEREKVLIESEQGKYECWVYLYQDGVEDLTLIASGNYLDYLSDPNSEHWKFIRSV
ncbi:MAG: gamma-glutamylcyclotransferase family protein [Bacteroidota bacterium]